MPVETMVLVVGILGRIGRYPPIRRMRKAAFPVPLSPVRHLSTTVRSSQRPGFCRSQRLLIRIPKASSRIWRAAVLGDPIGGEDLLQGRPETSEKLGAGLFLSIG